MFLKNIKLKNIRNYSSVDLAFDKAINIILGENGQGKTNLIESIYIAAFSKSFRTHKEKEMIMFEKEFGRIEIDYEKDGFKEKLEFAMDRKGKKIIKVSGRKINRTSQLLGNVLVVIFSPEDLKIVKEEPEKRRSFIDRELCQLKISYYNNLSKYKRILKQRNAALKDKSVNRELVEIWDETLVEYGEKIIESRKEFIDKINKISKEIHNKIKKEENLEVKYRENVKAEDFKKVIKENIEKDMSMGTTTKGPHKDDIEILINGINARRFGSQGQQRTVALALKLAEIELIKEEKEESPILLLDDVMSELDEGRQQFLIKALEGVQLFITTTHLSENVLGKFKDAKIINVEKGNIV